MQATEGKELYFAALALATGQLGWAHVKPNNSNKGVQPHAALRTCRRLQTESNLLASTLHDDGESFYVIYAPVAAPFASCRVPVLSFASLLQLLAEFDCVVLDSSESGHDGVPSVVVESALKLALRVHLNQRGWYGVDSCTFVRSPDPHAFPPASSSSVLVDAVEMVHLSLYSTVSSSFTLLDRMLDSRVLSF
jgi:hypothetical protein